MPILHSLNSIRSGMTIIYKGEPHLVLEANFMRMQQRKPVMQTKMKNIVNGKVIEYSFKPVEKIEEAEVERKKISFLYRDSLGSHFMDNESYEQFTLKNDVIGDNANFLKEGSEVTLLSFQEKPLGIQIPVKMDFTVTSAAPGVKGDTASGKVTKPVTIETGYTLNAPLFVKEGDKICVNTQTGEYVGRV